MLLMLKRLWTVAYRMTPPKDGQIYPPVCRNKKFDFVARLGPAEITLKRVELAIRFQRLLREKTSAPAIAGARQGCS